MYEGGSGGVTKNACSDGTGRYVHILMFTHMFYRYFLHMYVYLSIIYVFLDTSTSHVCLDSVQTNLDKS